MAMREGALGGKMTGAGGGGYMLFYCDFERKHRLAEALTRMGGVVTDVAFERRGRPPGAPDIPVIPRRQGCP